MNILPAQDTTDITLLPRPYSDVVDAEKDHPNMLYVAKDVRGITPYALTFNDVGKSMLNEGGADNDYWTLNSFHNNVTNNDF